MAAECLAHERGTGEAETEARQDGKQGHGDQDVCCSQFGRADYSDDPESNDKAGGKEQLLYAGWAGYPDKRAGFLAGRQPPHESVLPGVCETQVKIDHGADAHRDGTCHTGAGYTQRWCPEMPENQHII